MNVIVTLYDQLNFEKIIEKLLNDKEYDYYFMNSTKHYNIAVNKTNAFLSKFISNPCRDSFIKIIITLTWLC